MLVHGLRLASHSLNEDVMLCYTNMRRCLAYAWFTSDNWAATVTVRLPLRMGVARNSQLSPLQPLKGQLIED